MNEEYCRCPGCGVCEAHSKNKNASGKIKFLKERLAAKDKELEVLRGFANELLDFKGTWTFKELQILANSYDLYHENGSPTKLLTGND
jgi:hypothetical protein